MKFNKILLLCLCLSFASITPMDELQFKFDEEELNLTSAKQSMGFANMLSTSLPAKGARLDPFLKVIEIQQKQLDQSLVNAIDGVILSHIKDEVVESRLATVKALLENGANPNRFHQGIPLLVYIFNSFVKNMLAGQTIYKKIFELVQLFVKFKVDLSLEYEIEEKHKIDVISAVNEISARYLKLNRTWVPLLQQMSNFLNECVTEK